MKAVVLFNLGGPDKLESVQPFLFNLFYDRSIISLPNPFRYILAKLISSRRVKEAQEIYSFLGGGSPIVPETKAQSNVLQKALGSDYHVFFAMRHWKPFAEEVVQQIQAGDFDEVILLPLYPQYSTTTSESFFDHWADVSQRKGLNLRVRNICCYPQDKGFIEAHIASLKRYIAENNVPSNARFLFSAHGLPEKTIRAGDPYQQHIEATVKQVLKAFPELTDTLITYQSRVGPLKWIEPYTDKEIERAGQEGLPLVVVPISFVSEHSETLYELDFEYKKLADESGVPQYFRVPALGVSAEYIESLADLVKRQKFKTCEVPLCRFPQTEKREA